MFALIGFVVGYAYGTRAGQKGVEDLKRAWTEIRASEQFQGLLRTIGDNAAGAVEQGLGDFRGRARTYLADRLREVVPEGRRRLRLVRDELDSRSSAER